MEEHRRGLRGFASWCGWEAAENGDFLSAQPEEQAGRERSLWLERRRQAGFASLAGQQYQGGRDPGACTGWDKDPLAQGAPQQNNPLEVHSEEEYQRPH